jgi:membrane protease subunit HflC
LSGDFKSFELDNYACWKITDPLLFVRTLRTEAVASERLRNIVYSQLLKAIGKMELKEVVNTKRKVIMDDVLRESRQQAMLYGVHIVDVRIKRTDLPNRDAIFQRMNAQRKMMANKYRFEGESEKRRIESEAELERDRILADATRQSLVIRGTADARAMQIFRDAISVSPDFYEFSKSLDVYRKSFKDNTKIIMSKDDPLLKYLD